jgi:hypothetical protein
MARNPREQGAQNAALAIEQTRRYGLTKDEVIEHFLFHEESGGFRGALNAAENARLGGEIEEEEKGEYALGWVITLAEAMRMRYGL